MAHNVSDLPHLRLKNPNKVNSG